MKPNNSKSVLKLSVLASALLAAGVGNLPSAQADVHPENADGGTTERLIENRYIIRLKEPPLALYKGTDPRFPAPKRLANRKLDLKSADSRAYVRHLQGEQGKFLDDASQLLGRAVVPFRPAFQFQHAYNGVVLEISAAEAEQLKSLPSVFQVNQVVLHELLTDLGPSLIGASRIWAGETISGVPSQGAGLVVGIIDSGINMGSSSFWTTSFGAPITNPLGDGVYLGWCDPANPNHDPARDICNSKLIGGWDFVDSVVNGVTNYDSPGFEDEGGHGSHTASTAAGDARFAAYNGLSFLIAGVAPQANVVAYDVCFSGVGTEPGDCPGDATLAAADQAVVDQVDAINFSISGGINPWTDATSQAFLAAQEAGIFVAASAGNTRTARPPLAGSTNHQEPWVMTVAASSHTRGEILYDFSITGPSTVPTALTRMLYSVGTTGTSLSPAYGPTTAIIMSPAFLADPNIGNDGCSAYAPNTFTRGGIGAIAVLRRGGCNFTVKLDNAYNAGASAVIFANNEGTSAILAPGGSGGMVPALGISADTGSAMRSFLISNASSATAQITTPGYVLMHPANVMADFSLLGPAQYDFIKPDVTGPGVSIIAAGHRTEPVMDMDGVTSAVVNTSLNQNILVQGGTSMSSPHVAGAGILMKSVHPSWSPMEIKSALVTTATREMIVKPDGTTAADAFNRGGGLVNLHAAVRAGLVLDETADDFRGSNPAMGGNPRALNVPSFQELDCLTTCNILREVKSVAAATTEWSVRLEGMPTGSASITPATSFELDPGATRTLTLAIDGTRLSASRVTFGELVLEPMDTQYATQRIPIAVKAVPAEINLSASVQDGITVNVTQGQSQSQTMTIANQGQGRLNWAIIAGSQTGPLLSQLSNHLNGSAATSSVYTMASASNQFAADDFFVNAPAAITSLQANGYIFPVFPSGDILQQARNLNFYIYADAGGVPAGVPESMAGAAPIWSFTTSVQQSGVSIVGDDNIILDLVSAGAPALNLASGRYWLVVAPTFVAPMPAYQWLWQVALTTTPVPTAGHPPKSINPTTMGSTWLSFVDGTTGGTARGMNMAINGSVDCSPSWLVASSIGGTLTMGQTVDVSLAFNSGMLAVGTYTGYLCVSSLERDPDEVMSLVPVTMNVTSGVDPIFRDGFENP